MGVTKKHDDSFAFECRDDLIVIEAAVELEETMNVILVVSHLAGVVATEIAMTLKLNFVALKRNNLSHIN